MDPNTMDMYFGRTWRSKLPELGHLASPCLPKIRPQAFCPKAGKDPNRRILHETLGRRGRWKESRKRRRKKPRDRERRRRGKEGEDEPEGDDAAGVDVAEEEVDAADEAEVAKATATPCKKKRKFMPLQSPNKLPANEVETVVMSGPQKAKSMLAKVRDEKKKAMDAKKSLIAQNKVLKKDGQT